MAEHGGIKTDLVLYRERERGNNWREVKRINGVTKLKHKISALGFQSRLSK